MNGKLVLVVYEGERVLGEVELQNSNGDVLVNGVKEIRISHFSPTSERCPPLAVLHTINSTGICFKLESTAKNRESPLSLLHATCLRDNKAAVTSIGGSEVHLVAMHSRKDQGQFPCFWGFNVASSLYNSCLAMLNLRCLGIVFDLDETLIVANTMRSFEDKMDALQRKISSETDPQRVSGMMSELKRYQEDKNILKHYAETDQVTDNGKVIKSQSEVVLAMSDDQQTIVRPLIRLQDRNIILTRINPMIRDTSVLVRLRPAWEDLRNYLTAKGRKRFEVFVCTMAERDYALEMWRLLDPESNLISPRELLNRIVCVKSGSKKTLFNVFHDGICHPKMALVIDDRLKVWDEKDQPRVHVVPAFTPYFSPQAEANSNAPVLCLARNVACTVRGGFFKEFDDGLMQGILDVAFEDDAKDMPSPPDVSNYVTSEDDPSASSGNKDSSGFDGMTDTEVKEAMSASSALPAQTVSIDPRIASVLQYALTSSSTVIPSKVLVPNLPPPSQQLPQVMKVLKPPLVQLGQAEATLHGSPAREEGEVPESELDPDTRRRLLILQHGEDIREPSSETQFASRPSLQAPVPRVTPQGWFPIEEEMSPRQLNRTKSSVEFSADPIPDRHRIRRPPFLHKGETSIPRGRLHDNQRAITEEPPRGDLLRLDQPSHHFRSSLKSRDSSLAKVSLESKDLSLEAGQIDSSPETSAAALQEIAFKCGAKVEFKQSLLASTELQFSVEVFFAGQKIGMGIGNTRREAQRQAVEVSLLNLGGKSSAVPHTGSMPPRMLEPSTGASRKPVGSISMLKELCTMEGFEVAFQTRPNFSFNRGQKNEVYAEVEINGQVLGKGIGLTWDEAKSQAAEKALGALRPMLAQSSYKRQASPRSIHQGLHSKRSKSEFSRAMPRMTTSVRHPRSGSPIP